jgi:hypothetical protein
MSEAPSGGRDSRPGEDPLAAGGPAGNPRAAAEHLALAAAMRPDLPHYAEALRDVRITLRRGPRNEGRN